MDIFVGKLHHNTTKRELRAFFAPYIQTSWLPAWWPFNPPNPPVKCQLFEATTQHGSKEYFAVVSLSPDHLAAKAIKALHLKKLHGKPVFVRKYHQRKASNDRRRAIQWNGESIPPSGNAKPRESDRRRKLEIEPITQPIAQGFSQQAIKRD